MSSIAVFAPDTVHGHNTFFRRLVSSLVVIRREIDPSLTVVVAGEKSRLEDSELLSADLRAQVETREIMFKSIAHAAYCEAYGAPVFSSVNYALPFDFGYSLMDCEQWMFVSPNQGVQNLPFAPIKPYFAYGSWMPERDRNPSGPINLDDPYYASRLSHFMFLRGATRVLSMSSFATEDVVATAGVQAGNITTLPYAFSPLPTPEAGSHASEGPIVCCTDSHLDSDWRRLMDIFTAYYQECGGQRDILVCDTPSEQNQHNFGRRIDAADAYWSSVLNRLEAPSLSRVRLAGPTTATSYAELLAAAPLVISYRDTGPIPPAVIDAGLAAMPVLTSDYNEAREAARLSGAAARYFDNANQSNREIAAMIDDTIANPALCKDAELMDEGENSAAWVRILKELM